MGMLRVLTPPTCSNDALGVYKRAVDSVGGPSGSYTAVPAKVSVSVFLNTIANHCVLVLHSSEKWPWSLLD